MTEESGEEENDTRKVKVMKRKAKGALKSKGKVRSSMDYHNGLFMVQLLCRHAVSTGHPILPLGPVWPSHVFIITVCYSVHCSRGRGGGEIGYSS